MDYRFVARAIATLRVGIGLALLVTPRQVLALWGPRAATGTAGTIAARAAGVRDIALGAGTIHALEHEHDPQTWVRLGAACDLLDSASALLTVGRGRLSGVMLSAAAGATAGAIGLHAATELD